MIDAVRLFPDAAAIAKWNWPSASFAMFEWRNVWASNSSHDFPIAARWPADRPRWPLGGNGCRFALEHQPGLYELQRRKSQIEQVIQFRGDVGLPAHIAAGTAPDLDQPLDLKGNESLPDGRTRDLKCFCKQALVRQPVRRRVFSRAYAARQINRYLLVETTVCRRTDHAGSMSLNVYSESPLGPFIEKRAVLHIHIKRLERPYLRCSVGSKPPDQGLALELERPQDVATGQFGSRYF